LNEQKVRKIPTNIRYGEGERKKGKYGKTEGHQGESDQAKARVN